MKGWRAQMCLVVLVPWWNAPNDVLCRCPVGNSADATVLRGQRWTGTASGPVAGRHGRVTSQS